jgi:hypothetical protein
MGIFTQSVFIPQPIYRLLPLLYLATGLFLWVVVDHQLANLAAVILILFALFITMKRLFRQRSD